MNTRLLGMRTSRRINGTIALAILGSGVFLVVFQPGRHPQNALALGLWFTLLGTAHALWVWRGDWTEPDAARIERTHRLIARMFLAFGAVELLLLSLALLGLVFPERFAEYWQDHRFLVLLVGAGLVADVVTRGVRYVASRQTRPRNAEPAS